MQKINELREKIEELGLTNKESRVYIAALEMGNATAEQLAKHAKLNRSTTYVQIDSLSDKGLISKFKDGKKTKFNAESPLNLRRLLQHQTEELQSREAKAKTLMPQLLNIFGASGERPVVRYFEGKEGLKSMREDLLKVKSKQYYAAASIDALRRIFSIEELDAFSKQRAKKGISVKLMYTLDGDPSDPVGNQDLLRINEKKFPFSSDIYIYDDHVSFASTNEKVFGIIIQSQSIAQTMRSMFDMVWQDHSN